MTTYDEVWNDQAAAALDLVGRTGARQLEIGHLHENVPVDQAAWYAKVTYQGARVIEENHTSPAAALEALAVQLLTGAMCNHCKGLVALTRAGAVFFPDAHHPDGSVLTEAEARSRPQCHWRRVEQRWVRGCEKTP
jgi:hypothetical protein